jgi:hypothetical protein
VSGDSPVKLKTSSLYGEMWMSRLVMYIVIPKSLKLRAGVGSRGVLKDAEGLTSEHVQLALEILSRSWVGVRS